MTMKSCFILGLIIFLTIYIIRLCTRIKFYYDFCHEYKHLSLENVIKTHNQLKKNIERSPNKENVNIVFFLSFDYNKMPSYYNQVLKVLTSYCKYHNNKLVIFDHNKDDQNKKISPYWIRVADFIKLSNLYNKDTTIVYLDIDTCINPKYFDLNISNITDSIDKIENKLSDIYIGADPSGKNQSNAGIIILKNTDWSKQFLKLWWSKYKPDNWKLINGKWICKQSTDKFCEWARENYEQGEFNIIYNNNELDAQNHIKILHHSLISNSNILLDGFIYHFYANNRSFIKQFFIDRVYNNYKKYNIDL